MLKKFILGLVAFAFLGMPVYAQFDFNSTADLDDLKKSYLNDISDYNAITDNSDMQWENLTDEEQAAAYLATIFGGAMLFFVGVSLVLGLFSYVYVSLALMTVGNKVGIKDSWQVWVPILNLFWFAKVANLNLWTLLLFLIPGVNAFYGIYLSAVAFMNLSEKRGLDKMLGLLIFVPVVNYIYIGYLAWANITPKAVTA